MTFDSNLLAIAFRIENGGTDHVSEHDLDTFDANARHRFYNELKSQAGNSGIETDTLSLSTLLVYTLLCTSSNTTGGKVKSACAFYNSVKSE